MSSKQLSYVHQIGKYPLKYINYGNVFEESIRKFPTREAIVDLAQDKRLTFEQVFNLADKFAAGLNSIGLTRGDKLGIWAPNLYQWCIIYLGCIRAGIIVVCLIAANQASELEYCINKVGIKAIACLEEDKHQEYYRILTTIAPELENSLPGQLNSKQVPTLQTVILISNNKQNGAFNFDEIMDLATDEKIQFVKNNQDLVLPHDPIHIKFSSGTTGKPKAILTSHFQVINNAFEAGTGFEICDKYHKICMQIKFFHVFGSVVGICLSIQFGSTIVIPSPTYSPKANLKALKEEKCTVVYGTPTMFVDLIKLQKCATDPCSAEIAVIGAAPFSPHLIEQMTKILNIAKPKFIYGLSETNSLAFYSPPYVEAEFDNVGLLGNHLEAKVVDANNQVVPRGTPGELCIRGFATMLGYYRDEEKTKQIIGADKWLRTGDLFVIREDGYGEVVGRLTDMIIRGGENIYPTEIENLLVTHSDISEVYVIGLSHERLGEEVCACVTLQKEVENFNLDTMRNFCKGKIALYKIPTQLKIVEDFPKTSTGKVQKYVLRQLFEN